MPRSTGNANPLVLREEFAGKVALQTEKQIQAAAVRVRGNAYNSVNGKRLFLEKKLNKPEKPLKN
jgi:violaxanthin de-epoxidase